MNATMRRLREHAKLPEHRTWAITPAEARTLLEAHDEPMQMLDKYQSQLGWVTQEKVRELMLKYGDTL